MRKTLWITAVILLALMVSGSVWAADRSGRERGVVLQPSPVDNPAALEQQVLDDVEATQLTLDPEQKLMAYPACGGSYSGTMGSSGSRQFQASNRLFRDGVPSACPRKGYWPGILGGGPWHYDVWEFNPEGSDYCYTVVFNGGSCGAGYDCHPAVYCGYYPQGVSLAQFPSADTAFIGDSGSSPAAYSTVTFRFCMAAGQTWSLLATNVYSNNSCTYSFTVSCASYSCTGYPSQCLSSGCTPDRMGPTIYGIPPDTTASCDNLPGMPDPAGIYSIDNCPQANPARYPVVYAGERIIPGNCPGNYTIERTWTATDNVGNVGRRVWRITVRDTTGPVGVGSTAVVACIWPPNHSMVAIDTSGLQAVNITDNCNSGPFRYDIQGAVSDQCDEAPCSQYPGQNGDGDTVGDIFLGVGNQLYLRSERCGTEPEGRRYGVTAIPYDSCGNRGAPFVVGSVLVPHDSSDIPAGMECYDAAHSGEK